MVHSMDGRYPEHLFTRQIGGDSPDTYFPKLAVLQIVNPADHRDSRLRAFWSKRTGKSKRAPRQPSPLEGIPTSKDGRPFTRPGHPSE